ncbi:outer membrane beta-barrel protein [Fulvivirgaceae bacterium PWU5]|uniref:Outer membrane beta-barrel protein n=1 Tax=Dawidia cretensis TaxID=2782350 RepID=A0AAP2DWZ6_9BACT|nr:PorT family protein [Dawidia cretensis]MBT1707718.1 outer membrane beta-barrel protein [Dawidia cretensis]
MIRRIAVVIAFVALVAQAFGQETTTTTTTKRKGHPDIPGNFTLELGVNRASGAPDNFSLGLWGSRTVNIYYQYDIRILKSGFSFIPGIGLSMERFKFKNEYTLAYNADSVFMVSPATAGFSNLKKSMLITNYVEVPLELCFRTNPEDPARSFRISIGGRVGYMFDSFGKIKYKEDGEVKKIKDKQDFGLNKFRYGVFGKIGVGNFSVFGYANMTDLFKDGLSQNRQPVDFSTFTVGISLSSF